MGDQTADVAYGSGGWEERIEAEERRRAVTDLSRGRAGWTDIGPRFGKVFRVQTDDDGDLIARPGGGAAVLSPTATYVLVAANNRTASIDVESLRYWLLAFFDFTNPRRVTRNGRTILNLTREHERTNDQAVIVHTQDGSSQAGVFTAGDWTVRSSAGLDLHIRRNQASTALEALIFTRLKSGRIVARYPHQKNAPVAVAAATEA